MLPVLPSCARVSFYAPVIGSYFISCAPRRLQLFPPMFNFVSKIQEEKKSEGFYVCAFKTYGLTLNFTLLFF